MLRDNTVTDYPPINVKDSLDSLPVVSGGICVNDD